MSLHLRADGAHMDVLQEETPRMATVLLYLTDTEEGGETAFPAGSTWSDPVSPQRFGPFSECAQGSVAVRPRKGASSLLVPTAHVDLHHSLTDASVLLLARSKACGVPDQRTLLTCSTATLCSHSSLASLPFKGKDWIRTFHGHRLCPVKCLWQHVHRLASCMPSLGHDARGCECCGLCGRAGQALVFYSLFPDSKTQDQHSMHTGCPVLQGIKWTGTVWIHTAPFRPESLSRESELQSLCRRTWTHICLYTDILQILCFGRTCQAAAVCRAVPPHSGACVASLRTVQLTHPAPAPA